MHVTRAFVHPGQGSQRPGMGEDLLGHATVLDRMLDRARELVGHDFSSTGTTDGGTTDAQGSTVAVQVGVFALSVALVEELARLGVHPRVVAGHSLGEYSALVSGGWLELDDALSAVAARAAAMDACCREHPGAMAAVVGLGGLELSRFIERTETAVVLANLNGPTQGVVSGTHDDLARFGQAVRQAGRGTVLPLPVAGAFHSPLMADAQRWLAPLIDHLPLRRGPVPLVTSITGEVVTDVEAYRQSLLRQITQPVRWEQTMHVLRAEFPGPVLEVGPGDVLRKLFRRFDRHIPVTCCGNHAECRLLAEALAPDSDSALAMG
jgi:[acyl-carrier-protein] S-malonyltransferase